MAALADVRSRFPWMHSWSSLSHALTHCSLAVLQVRHQLTQITPLLRSFATSLPSRPSSCCRTSAVCSPSSGPAHVVPPGVPLSLGTNAGTVTAGPPDGGRACAKLRLRSKGATAVHHHDTSCHAASWLHLGPAQQNGAQCKASHLMEHAARMVLLLVHDVPGAQDGACAPAYAW